MSEFKVIGKGVPRIDAIAKATGKAIYCEDFNLPGMLYGKALHSAYPHAKILRLDVSKAKALPGVEAVLTAKDLLRNDYYHFGDSWVLADEEVNYIGDLIAIVAAESVKIAEKAIRLIEVDYEPLPIVAHLSDAADPDGPRVHQHKESNIARRVHVVRGDVDGDFEKATAVVSGKYVFPSLHTLHLEPNSATATFSLGKLTVYGASQVWFHTRKLVAKITGIKESNVTIKPLEIGGAFGSRNEQIVPVLAALLAVKTKRPVQFTNDRLEEFLATRPFVGMEMEMTLAADDEGNILSKKTKILSDFGAFTSDAIAVLGIACVRADTNYRFKSVEVEGLGLYTNRPPTSAYRAFGNQQAHFAMETLIDELASKLNMSPIEIRLKNFAKPDSTSIHGYKITSCGLEECMEKAVKLMDWENKISNKIPGKGLGVAALMHVSSSRAGEPEFSGGSAAVKVDSSGRITAYVGEAEIGQGACMVMAQIVAEEFGIEPHEVNVVMGDTEECPFSTGTHGTKLTTVHGNAVMFACRDVKEQITKVLRERKGLGPVEIKNGEIVSSNSSDKIMDFVDAVKEASYLIDGRPFIGMGAFTPDCNVPDNQYGNPAPTFIFGIQMAEVTVHENGSYTVDNIISVHDIGRVINPHMALGQVYGGVMQGYGFTTTEDLAVNDEGIYLANTILEYKIPTILEMPEMDVGFVETIDQFGPYGAKGIAEAPIISVAPAVVNAICNATGVRYRDIPITPSIIQKYQRSI